MNLQYDKNALAVAKKTALKSRIQLNKFVMSRYFVKQTIFGLFDRFIVVLVVKRPQKACVV